MVTESLPDQGRFEKIAIIAKINIKLGFLVKKLIWLKLGLFSQKSFLGILFLRRIKTAIKV